MRPRTPTAIYLPFVFSVGMVSWSLLIASLLVLAAVVLAPVTQSVRTAQVQLNDLTATVGLLRQRVALQKEFVQAAATDPLVLLRLASRQLGAERADEEVLPLANLKVRADRSVGGLLAESLTPVEPEAVAEVPWFVAAAGSQALRPLLMVLACGGLALSFLLGVRYER
jgi:hypothetical protein